MVQVRWLKDARTDLKEIYDYISLDSKNYAKFQVERIQEYTKRLKTHPNIGKKLNEIDNLEIKELIQGNYRIIYRNVSKERVDILLIHHGARNLKSRLKKYK